MPRSALNATYIFAIGEPHSQVLSAEQGYLNCHQWNMDSSRVQFGAPLVPAQNCARLPSGVREVKRLSAAQGCGPEGPIPGK